MSSGMTWMVHEKNVFICVLCLKCEKGTKGGDSVSLLVLNVCFGISA
jgi:hypothetical protein